MKNDLKFALAIATEGPRRVCITVLDPQPRVRFTLAMGDGFKVQGDDLMFTLTDVQKATATITVLDAKGNPAPLDGAPSWSSSDPSVVAVEPSTDGLSVVIKAVGPLGTAQVRVDADADLGASVVPLQGVLDVEVVASQAVSIVINPGPAEPQ